MARRGRPFAWGTKREWPAYTLDDSQVRKLLTGKKNLGLWVGDRIMIVDYKGKLVLCPKNHANTLRGTRKMRKVM